LAGASRRAGSDQLRHLLEELCWRWLFSANPSLLRSLRLGSSAVFLVVEKIIFRR
jgi:hypothetical protein